MKNIKTSELYFQNGEKITDYLRQAVNLEKYIDDKRSIIDAYYSKGNPKLRLRVADKKQCDFKHSAT